MSDYKRQNPVGFREAVGVLSVGVTSPGVKRCPDCATPLRGVIEPHRIFDPYCPSCKKSVPRP
jgi:hypothetical protein